ncbi:hypothetical protein [Streptomyces sp. NPDC059802]|uniref:hypothetical protein n=1 Tax=Streptomyces sp. NPDC059802 TaxID=3346952 RepID=UPI00364FBCFC
MSTNLLGPGLGKYDLASRSAKVHRTQIREALGFRPATRTDGERLTAWLAVEVCPVELVEGRLRDALFVRCRSDRLEVPACDVQMPETTLRLSRGFGEGMVSGDDRADDAGLSS